MVDSISDTAVMNTLKKTNLSPGRKKWCIPKAEARRIAVRLEILRGFGRFHASWLNMAEIEIGTLSRQCLAQQIMSFEEMKRQVCSLAVSEEFFFSYSCLAVLRC